MNVFAAHHGQGLNARRCSMIKYMLLLWKTVGILCKSSSSSTSIDTVFRDQLKCEITYTGKKEGGSKDMSKYKVLLTSNESIKGRLRPMFRKSADADAWEEGHFSSPRIRLEAKVPKRISISGKWSDNRYYKLVLTTDKKEAYETVAFFKKNGKFEEVSEEKKEEPKADDKKESKKGSTTNWKDICLYGIIIALVFLLGAMALRYHKK